ncbi:virulence RhuM family protein [bacterium]|nr:virulence RhuM family protein [bacterium]MBU1959143.1 virulence RhuM family protein [bacterium]
MNTVIYDNGELDIKISVEDNTIWLTQKQIVEIFDSSKSNISEHIKSIYQSNELDKLSTVRKFRTVQKEGNREVQREREHYNLDMIISIGYRVNSLKATKFRQWATSILKSYISDRYVINFEKITHQRFKELENDVSFLKEKVGNISNQIENKSIKQSQGIFFDGEVYDAYAFISNLIRSAKKSIIVVDNYIDDTILTLFSKNSEVKISIYTKTITKQLELDSKKYNAQYKNLEIKKFNLSHDRFLIIDDEIYHIGASLKDLGKKWFAFSKMDKGSVAIMERLK